MTLSELADVGELVGGVAAVASLVLTERPGPLSKRLLATIDELAREHSRAADASAR